ncbi:MAG: hypothetical protein RLZ12_610, partial [Bacillota bacterium]
ALKDRVKILDFTGLPIEIKQQVAEKHFAEEATKREYSYTADECKQIAQNIVAAHETAGIISVRAVEKMINDYILHQKTFPGKPFEIKVEPETEELVSPALTSRPSTKKQPSKTLVTGRSWG